MQLNCREKYDNTFLHIFVLYAIIGLVNLIKSIHVSKNKHTVNEYTTVVVVCSWFLVYENDFTLI